MEYQMEEHSALDHRMCVALLSCLDAFFYIDFQVFPRND